MVKLLFLSNNRKVDDIKNSLQHLYELEIEVVADYDEGLEFIFEKRPDIVFLQDQISDVAGEIIIHHIQLFLGADAPVVIFMRSGDAEVRPAEGLYKHFIDLSRSDSEVLGDIQDIFELLLGPKLQKIIDSSIRDDSAKEAPLTQSEENSFTVVNCLDDFLIDSERFTQAASLNADQQNDDEVSGSSPEPPLIVLSSADDQPPDPPSNDASEKPERETATASASCVSSEMRQSSSTPFVFEDEPPEILTTASKLLTVEKTAENAAVLLSVPDTVQIPPISTAEGGGGELKIPVDSAQADSQWTFDGEQRLTTSSRSWYLTIELLLVLVLLVGGVYLVSHKPEPAPGIAKNTVKPAEVEPVPPSRSVPAEQRPESLSHKSGVTSLPAFIPKNVHDPEFRVQNPGWERYKNSEFEFRTFRVGDRFKVFQVIALKEQKISPLMLRTILLELAGEGEYRVTSRENKHGFEVLHAEVTHKAELLIYSKKYTVKAVVVSLN